MTPLTTAQTQTLKVDEYVKHIFRKHNQEADHLANLGAEGQRHIIIDKGSNTERWKAVRAFWDGSSKNNGRSGCGVVIKGVDRNKWITVKNIAVPLGIGLAIAAEVVGVCVLMGILDFVLHECLSVKSINPCIDAILKNH